MLSCAINGLILVEENSYEEQIKEIFNFYDTGFHQTDEVKTAILTYHKCLKSCSTLGATDPKIRSKASSEFLTSFLDWHRQANHNPSTFMGLFTAGFTELTSLIEVMSQSIRWEDQAGALVAIRTILEHDSKLLNDENHVKL